MSLQLRRVTFLLLLLVLAAMSLLGQPEQESPYDVNGPADQVPVAWYDTPILWIGLVIFLLVGVLYFLRGGSKTPTNGRLHRDHATAKNGPGIGGNSSEAR